MASLVCKGFASAGVAAGIKKNGALDLGLLFSDRPAKVAAVFTKNRVQAAPVLLDKERIRSGMARALIANSGNANCSNGPDGIKAVEAVTKAVARAMQLEEDDVLAASTGVIGAPFPTKIVEKAIPELVSRLTLEGTPDLASAIMTTDTVPKVSARRGSVGGQPYCITAVAKGAGMIRPDMATMLCFAFTDAELGISDLQTALKRAVTISFNAMTIDGDTSTNDTVILMANGASGAVVVSKADRDDFQRRLDDLFVDLARQMVKDGEGVTKVVDVTVRGAESDTDAACVADTIAHSPLVKTAFFGEDANWGRIIAAAGRAGVPLDPDRLDLYFDEVQMVKNGTGCGAVAEATATAVLKQPELSVTLDLKLGQGVAKLLTCDFSVEYVKINADYRS